MARPGPKPKPAEVHQLHGGFRPAHHTGGELGQDSAEYKPARPKWVKGARALRYWKAKIAEYNRRGQRIEGFEDSLGDYCLALAELEETHLARRPIPGTLRQSLFKYYSLFYDTPADAVAGGQIPRRAQGNPFARHGKRE